MTDHSTLQQFSWFDDPARPPHYLTRTELGKLGLKPPAEPVGYIYWQRKRITYYLYDQRLAKPKRKPTEAQIAVLAKAQETLKTCEVCGTIGEARIPSDQRLVGVDDTGKEKVYRVCMRCYGCLYDEERRIEVLHLRRWAQRALHRNYLILNIETTADKGEMQIGIIDCTGTLLMDKVVKLRDDAATADDFLAILPVLESLMHGKIVMAYNRSFNRATIGGCLYERGIEPGPWLQKTTWVRIEMRYSEWVGELTYSGDNYRIQKLDKSGNALDGCVAALNCVKEMAAYSMLGPFGYDSVILGDY